MTDHEAAIRERDRSQMTRGDMSLAIDTLLAELAAAREQIDWHKATKQALMDAHEAAVLRERALREALHHLYWASGAVIAEDEPAEYMKTMREQARAALAATEPNNDGRP